MGKAISLSDCARQTTELLRPGKGTKHRPNRICASEGYLSAKPERLRPGRCMQPRAGLRLFLTVQHRAWAVCAESRGRPSRAETLQAHANVLLVCSIPPSPQCDWTSEPKKKSAHHRSPCIRVEIRHWRYQQTEEAKQREPPWKWPHTAHNTRERVRYIFTIFITILFFFFLFLLMLLCGCFFFFFLTF